jgi:hypothetical protein
MRHNGGSTWRRQGFWWDLLTLFRKRDYSFSMEVPRNDGGAGSSERNGLLLICRETGQVQS